METSNQTYGTSVKLLAIIGFFSILALFVWLIIQGLRYFPTAVESLATIAETVGGYRPNSELLLNLERDIVHSGDTVALTWTEMGNGTYTFTHTCEDDTTLSIRTDEESLRELSCNDTLSLPNDALGLFLTPKTTDQRFSEVSFEVTFIPQNAKLEDQHVALGSLTVINASVPSTPNIVLDRDDEREETVKPTPSVIELPTPVVVPPPAPVVTPTPSPSPAPLRTQVASPVVALIPKSYENGFIDLRTLYQGVGIMKNGTFVPQASFSRKETVALRFEVKNIGTKVSGTWTYELILPGDLTYTSTPQAPLMPNERAVLTAQFELEDVTTKNTTVEGSVTTGGEKNTNNNTFSWSVGIVD